MFYNISYNMLENIIEIMFHNMLEKYCENFYVAY